MEKKIKNNRKRKKINMYKQSGQIRWKREEEITEDEENNIKN